MERSELGDRRRDWTLSTPLSRQVADARLPLLPCCGTAPVDQSLGGGPHPCPSSRRYDLSSWLVAFFRCIEHPPSPPRRLPVIRHHFSDPMPRGETMRHAIAMTMNCRMFLPRGIAQKQGETR